MNKVKLSVLSLVVFSSLGFGQEPNSPTNSLCEADDFTDENVIVPYTDFWFGGFNTGFNIHSAPPGESIFCRYLEQSYELGFNMYYVFSHEPSYYFQRKYFNAISEDLSGPNQQPVELQRNGVPNVTNILPNWYGTVGATNNGNILASEMRYFLASNWDLPQDSVGASKEHLFNFETQWGWDSVAEQVSPQGNGLPEEQYFSLTDQIPNSGGYLLKNLSTDERALNLGGSEMKGFTVSLNADRDTTHSPIDTIICDFIFRLDDADYTMSSDDTVYLVEYFVKDTGSFTFRETPIATATITPRYYEEYRTNALSKSSSVWNTLNYAHGSSIAEKANDYIISENKGITQFPKWDLSGARPQERFDGWKDYATIRTVLIVPGKNDGVNFIAAWKQIDCRVKRVNAGGIFIRGLRIRSPQADELLRGKYDNTILEDQYNKIKAALQGYSKSGAPCDPSEPGCIQDTKLDVWNKTSLINAYGENLIQGWRAYAYIDNYIWKRSNKTKHLLTFQVDNEHGASYPYFRAVYEDEIGRIPPMLVPECDEIYGINDRDEVYVFDPDSLDFEPALPGNFMEVQTGKKYATSGYPKDVIPQEYIDERDDSGPRERLFTLYSYPVQEYDVFSKRNQDALSMCIDMKMDREVASTTPPGRDPSQWVANLWTHGDIRDEPVVEDKNKDGLPDGIRVGARLGQIDPLTGIPEDNTTRRKIWNIVHGIGFTADPCDFDWRHAFWPEELIVDSSSTGGPDYYKVNTPVYVVESLQDPDVGVGDTNEFIGDEVHTNNELKPNRLNATPNSWGMYMVNRHMTSAEIRAEGWCNLAWGANGILFNTYFEESQAQMGIVDDQGRNHYDFIDDKLSIDDPDNVKRHIWDGYYWGKTSPVVPEAMFERWLIERQVDSNTWDTLWIERQTSDSGRFESFGSVEFSLTACSGCGEKTFGEWMVFLFDHVTDSLYKVIAQELVDHYAELKGLTPDTGWRPALDDCCGRTDQRWIATFTGAANCNLSYNTSNGEFYGASLYWPYRKNPELHIAENTFYGYKEKYTGVKNLADDIKPLMQTFNKLKREQTFALMDINDLESISSQIPISTAPGELISKKFKNKLNNATYWQTIAGSYSIDTSHRFLAESELDTLVDFYDTTDASEMQYEIGLFSEKRNADTTITDSLSRYLVIVNRRMWPLYYDEVNGEKFVRRRKLKDTLFTPDSFYVDDLLGPIDARRLVFQIKDVWDSLFTHYTYTNLRTGEEHLGAFADNETYHIDFAPGEGTLIKVSPVFSLTAGKTNERGMAYNNGRRIADISNSGTPPNRVMVWERDGSIFFRITNEPTEFGIENNLDPGGDAEVLVAPSPGFKFSNPSIASAGNDVVVVYSSQHNSGNRQVHAKWGTISSGAIDWTPTGVDNNPLALDIDSAGVPKDIDQPDQLLTPVITPGAASENSNGFLVAWSNSDDQGVAAGVKHYIETAYIRLDDSTGDIEVPFRKKIQAEATAVSSVFPTLASRDETAVEGADHERFHLAWEVDWDDGTSHIYYTQLRHFGSPEVWTQPNLLDTAKIVRVTKLAPGCKHQHPSIAVQNGVEVINGDLIDPVGEVNMLFGEPIITWEYKYSYSIPDPGDPHPMAIKFPSPDGKAVMARWRNSVGKWSSFDYIAPIGKNLPLPLIRPSVEASTSLLEYEIGRIDPFYWVTFMDSTSKKIRTSFIPMPGTWQGGITPLHFNIPEAGMYSNIALNYELVPNSSREDEMNTLVYRGKHRLYNDDGTYLYSTRVTGLYAHDILKQVSSDHVKTIAARSKELCRGPVEYRIAPPSLTCSDCPDSWYHQFGWTPFDISVSRPGYYEESDLTIYDWPTIEDSLRTEDFEYELGDTIWFDRFFLLEDTAWVSEFITESAHLTFSVLLKDSATSGTLAILDNIVIDTASKDIALQRFNEGSISLLSPYPPYMPLPSTGYDPQGPGRKVRYVLDTLPPSGKAYMTVKATKDIGTELVMVQINEEHDVFDPLIPEIGDSVLFKRAQPIVASYAPKASRIIMDIFPNPFNTSTTVKLLTIKDAPLTVVVSDILGRSIMTLFNGVSAQGTLTFDINSSDLSDGIYFVRASCGNEVVTKKVELRR